MRGTAEERFWAKVNKTETCWLWTANQNNRHYGLFTLRRGATVTAHRFSYGLAFGSIPSGLHVCHHCDTPLCVRPDHLFAGTNSDNMKDAIAKGRVSPPVPRVGARPERTHCKSGHPLSGDNVRIITKKDRGPRLARECRICRRAWNVAASQRRYGNTAAA